MTHTLHRKGTFENLQNDYVVFAISAQTVNGKGSAPKFAEFEKVILKYNPVSYGDMKTGNKFKVGIGEINKGYRDNSIVHAVFTDKAVVAKVLKELSEANTGLSIVVSGLLEATMECCHQAGLEPHTIEHSLGIHGRTERLPVEEILQINTMCGHGMVAFPLIEFLADKVKQGKMPAEKAAERLANLCHCGVFNPNRCAEIFRLMTCDAAEEINGDTEQPINSFGGTLCS